MSSAVDLKTKEEKDAELDKRIEALRKKNEALVKRYQEIEEDKKKAEQEGIAVTTPRKPRTHEPEAERRKTEKENLTVTVDLSKPAGQDKRIVNDWNPSTPRSRKKSEESDSPKGQSDGRSPPRRTGSGRVGRGGQRGGVGGGRQERRDRETRTPREGESAEPGGQGRRGGRRGGRGGRGGGGGGGGREGREGGAGNGGGEEGTPGGMDRKSKEWEEKRRQNIEKMNEEMERIAEYERGQRVDGDKPIRNFLDDPRRSGPAPDIDRKEGSRRHVRNWGGLDFDNVKTGHELEREWTSRRPGPKGGSVDMTMSMTGRERSEYLRWKKEREQIDEERLARHRNATGQWRREWDAQKTDSMFKEDPHVAAEGVTAEEGGRRADDSKRPPRGPTFGDFLSQGRSQGPRGDRSRGRGRGQRQSYSMHDNRWEGEKEEEEEKEKQDKTKNEVKAAAKKTKKEEEKPKAETEEPKVEEKNEDEAGDDDDEWEDTSEEEEAGDRSNSEKKDKGKAVSSPSAKQRLQEKTAGSPKEQRAPRPKVRIPPPAAAAAQESSDGGKPLSPCFSLESHRPVSDWGEEMEMQSPRSSMGAESPLKPSSSESSPPQKKESQDGGAGEPREAPTDESAPVADTQENVTESEPEQTASEPPPEASDLAPSSAAPQVDEVAVTSNPNPLPAPSEEGQSDPPRPAESVNGEQISSDAPVENEDDTPPAGSDDAPAAEAELSSDQTSSG
ncbi:coiled-coil domain-containing protein 9 isoform X1 [Poeciliopsis prolifica]|uniref:coiled-coil domain-containing protein 9 isoform X1 n=1 Tax=Poeciliopsis prolifica TaxID=188132 RepID=UPI0024136E33|nr:coiled-coil domain-containing protein 9 isoform X1 [Poeciliopsis prolifica]